MDRYSLFGGLLLINILAVGLTLTLTEWLESSNLEAITQADVGIFILFFLNISNFCLMAMLGGCVRLRRKREDNHAGYLHFLTQYIGLYVFGIGAIILSGLEVSSRVQCTPIIKKFMASESSANLSSDITASLHEVTLDYDVFTAQMVFKSICILLQLMFLSRFRDHRAVNTKSKFCILMTLAANALLYIVTFLLETKHKMHEDSAALARQVQANLPHNMNVDVVKCLNSSMSLEETVHHAEQYLIPDSNIRPWFEMEYCLTALGLLFTMIAFGSKKVRQKAADTMAENGNYSSPDGSEGTDNSDEREEVEGSEDTGDSTEAADDAGDDDAPLVPLDPEVIVGQGRERTFTDTSELEMTLSQSGMHCNHRERFNLAFNIGLFVSLILLILEGIYAYGEDGVREHIVFYLWAFRVGYYAALLVASVGCTVMFRKLLPHQGMKLGTEHILLLISATGQFVYLYFGVLAAATAFNGNNLHKMVEHADKNTTEGELLAENALNIVMDSVDIAQVGTQTFALIIATMGLPFVWHRGDPQRYKHILKELLYFLCVCNAAKWITDSFIEGHYLKSSEAKILVFGETTWTAITQTTYPLVLFYRFHSVHMVLKVIDKINSG